MKLFLCTIITLLGLTSCKKAPQTPAALTWKKHIIQPRNDAPEGQACLVNTAVASDFDKDGHMDVMASFNGKVYLYKGPNWERTVVLEDMPINPKTLGELRGCIHSTLMDVDGDGDMDFIGSNRTLWWLECPAHPFSDKWICRMINFDVNGAHCVITGDVDRDGKIDLIANSWRDTNASEIPNSITWFKVPADPFKDELWKPLVFANQDAPGGNHYMGLGDVNKDGRPDIACGAKGGDGFQGGGWFAWWEQPVNPEGAWEKHLLSDKEPGATNILPVDLDGDGQMDYLASRGHGMGVLWFKGPAFTKIDIDTTLKTPHSLAIADIDNDGDMDFASCTADTDGETVIYENDGHGHFTRHVIDKKQGSYDLRFVDMDGDGDLDILIAGHASRNVVWYENPLK